MRLKSKHASLVSLHETPEVRQLLRKAYEGKKEILTFLCFLHGRRCLFLVLAFWTATTLDSADSKHGDQTYGLRSMSRENSPKNAAANNTYAGMLTAVASCEKNDYFLAHVRQLKQRLSNDSNIFNSN